LYLIVEYYHTLDKNKKLSGIQKKYIIFHILIKSYTFLILLKRFFLLLINYSLAKGIKCNI